MKESPTNKDKVEFNIDVPEGIPNALSESTVKSLKNLSETIKRIREKFDLKKSETGLSFLNENEPINFISPAQIEAERHEQIIEVLNLSLQTQEKMKEEQEASGKAMLFVARLTLTVAVATLVVSLFI